MVQGALARPVADPAEVARLTEQVESARQLTATLLRTLRGVGITLAAALIGLALLAPAVLPLVLLPLLAAGLLFSRLLRPLVERRRAVVLAEERFAAEAGLALRADRVLLLDGGRGTLARHGDLQVLSPLYRDLVGHWLGSTPLPSGAPHARCAS
ncbi:hypothetical protein ACWCXH_06985 [Kitasatospora sp. NPDC001660]